MEYNTNTYITIAHSTCEALGLEGTHRMNNEQTICILEFGEGETIPTEITDFNSEELSVVVPEVDLKTKANKTKEPEVFPLLSSLIQTSLKRKV